MGRHRSIPHERQICIHGACSDAINGIAYTDDRAIVTACVLKRYSIDPRVEIAVYAFERNPTKRDDDPLEIIDTAEAPSEAPSA